MEDTYALKKGEVNNSAEMSRMARRKSKKPLLSYIFKTEEISQWVCRLFFGLVDYQQKREKCKKVGEGNANYTKSTISFIQIIYAAFFFVLIASITYFMAL
ncbi:hypothetical protein [Heyndrickxia acidicola]|uniref:Uncharacterized protein n=1 Tax=Heyndrickxia acidicola TaxID=209389 RepID=A0ABU6MB73_9BACI|nr:hypothetical protein [Heyndrickxia acidicola]MED1201926.1 hypothetical protein [Heyndrickxia acidicola]